MDNIEEKKRIINLIQEQGKGIKRQPKEEHYKEAYNRIMGDLSISPESLRLKFRDFDKICVFISEEFPSEIEFLAEGKTWKDVDLWLKGLSFLGQDRENIARMYAYYDTEFMYYDNPEVNAKEIVWENFKGLVLSTFLSRSLFPLLYDI